MSRSSTGNHAHVIGMGIKTGLGSGVTKNYQAMETGQVGWKSISPEWTASLWPEQWNTWNKNSTLGTSEMFDRAVDEVVLEGQPQGFDWESPRLFLWVATTKDNIFHLEEQMLENKCDSQARLGYTAQRLAQLHGMRGQVQTVSTACVSGSIALGMAAEAIEMGRCDRAVVVGVDVVSSFVLEGFSSFSAISAKGCRPFDLDRDGLSPGSAAGVMFLSRESEGVGVRVGGWASSNDANHVTGPSRDGRPLGICLERAMAKDSKPQCVMAHGTGTPYNDSMETKAILDVFSDDAPQLCCIKGNIGHCMGAAGLTEAIIATEMLKRSEVLPIAGLSRVEDDRLKPVINEKEPLRGEGILSCNSGFGGVNAAVSLWKV